LARVVTVNPVAGFLTGANAVPIKVSGLPYLDVAYWSVGEQVLVVVASSSYMDSTSLVDIVVPFGVKKIESTPWGNVTWSLIGNTLQVKGLSALATSLVILSS
jgi:hypothetical protein